MPEANTIIKGLLEKRAGLWGQMQPLLEKSDLSAEERESWDRFEADIRSISEDIERRERAMELGKVDYGSIIDARSGKEVDGDVADAVEDVYRKVFETWARHGMGELSPDERRTLRTGFVQAKELRAQGVGTTTAGGYLVPPEFRNKLVERMKYFSSMRAVAEVIQTETGADLPWPTNDDTSNVGAILAENTAMTEQDLTLGTASIVAYMYTSKMVRVSLQLLQDSGTNINEFIPRKLGERLGRIQNQHFTTGTGSSQPQGLITGGTAIQAPTGNTTAIPYDTLIDLMAGIDPAYLGGGNLNWMWSQAALASIRKLKDADGRPLWQPSLQVGQPDSLLGYGIVLNNDLATPAANAKSGAFGDFREGYLIRDVLGVQTMRLDERYAEFLQVAFAAFQRTGGTVQNSAAYRVYQNSAT